MPGVRNRARTRGQTIIIYTCKVKGTKPTNNYFFKTFYIDDVRLKKKKEMAINKGSTQRFAEDMGTIIQIHFQIPHGLI